MEIDGDAFRLDDHRLAHVELARSMSVLIVNGDPRTARNEDEPFFFAAALRNGLPSATVTIKLPDDVSPESLGGTTLVALLNVAQPSQALAAALARFVSAGGGLFVSVGDRVDATTWNENAPPNRKGRLAPPLGRRSGDRHPAAAPASEIEATIDSQRAPVGREPLTVRSTFTCPSKYTPVAVFSSSIRLYRLSAIGRIDRA